PIDPATVPMICEFGLDDFPQSLPEESPTRDKIIEILTSLTALPRLAARLRRRVDINRDETEQWLAQLARLVVQSPRIQQWAEKTAERFGQGEEGHHRLKALLDSQPYRLVHWRAAARTINYRRFFDVNELISIRQEDPRVFEETHATLLRWADEGLLDGLRIDHIDGLRDPLGYLERLAEGLGTGKEPSRPVAVFVEKILAPEETLPCGWPVTGTTGYEFLNQLEAIFVSSEGFQALEKQYRRLLRRPVHFQEVATWGKRRVLRNDLAPQVGRLADTLLRLAEQSRQTPAAVTEDEVAISEAQRAGQEEYRLTSSSIAEDRASDDPRNGKADFAGLSQPTKRDFVDALVEVATALPVYRTYVDSNHCSVSDADRRYVAIALRDARKRGRAAPEAIDFLGEVLLLENKARLPEHELSERVNFIQRFQQLTGPAAAKGIEDTAMYAYVPLVSLNEVGGEPHAPQEPVAKLHQANEERATTWPHTMLAVTTHDTKRTADVRARLDVLSELPTLWSGLIRRWQRLNRPYRSSVRGRDVPDATTEYLLYQTLVGIWPTPLPDDPHQLPVPEVLTELSERAEGYMQKAVREAKLHTSWTNVNQAYEDAVLSFVRNILRHEGDSGTPFLSDVQKLVARIARPGFWNSLSRTLIQFTAPGTPDLYQGDELWNFALVDPDNRRPVDYEKRKQLLDETITGIEGADESRQAFVRRLVELPEDGRIKLHVIHGSLAARGNYPRLFSGSQYIPLAAEGPASDHVVAFARIVSPPHGTEEEAAIAVAPRLTTSLIPPASAPIGDDVWSETLVQLPERLRERNWTNVFTRERLPVTSDRSIAVAHVLRSFPVALLISTR
ncbi:MAG: malto-oligosyltrehalose synthase, partial [Pirellulaceae bacterium]